MADGSLRLAPQPEPAFDQRSSSVHDHCMAASWKRSLVHAIIVAMAVGHAWPAIARPQRLDCLWNALSNRTKGSVFQAYEAGGTDGLANVDLEDPEVERVYTVCRPGRTASPAKLRATGIILIGLALEHAATRHLAGAIGVREERFRDAWQRLRPAERATLLTAYRKSGSPDDAVVAQTSPILDKAARLAGWSAIRSRRESADQLFHHYIQVFLGIAQSEAYADAL